MYIPPLPILKIMLATNAIHMCNLKFFSSHIKKVKRSKLILIIYLVYFIWPPHRSKILSFQHAVIVKKIIEISYIFN